MSLYAAQEQLPSASAVRAAASATLFSLVMALTGCDSFDEAWTARAPELTRIACKGTARVLDPANMWVGCEDGAYHFQKGQWIKAIEGRPTAALAPRGDRQDFIVALEGNKMAIVSAKGEVQTIKTPRLRAPKGGGFYSWRPPALEKIGDGDVASIHEIDSERLLAVTASNGAMISLDQGKTWKKHKWNARFELLNGSRPLEMRDLVVNDASRLAFLLFPEGEEIAREQFKMMLSRETAADTTNGGGPVVVTGFVADQQTEVRAVPTGKAHKLVVGTSSGANLWLFVGHNTRNEATRFQTNDWGREYLDTGYRDFNIIEGVGSRQRVALLGQDDEARTVLYIKGDELPARYALIDLPPGDAGLQMKVDDRDPYPRVMSLARGSIAIFYDLEPVGRDNRLFWYFYPIGFFLPCFLILMLMRFMRERQLSRNFAAATGKGGGDGG